MKPSSQSSLIEAIGHLIGYVSAYGQQVFTQLQIDIQEQLLEWQAQIFKRVIMGLFIMSSIGFGSIAIALYLGELLQSKAMGFGLVSVGFLFISFLSLILPNSWLRRLLYRIWPKAWPLSDLKTLGDLQKEKKRLAITSRYTQDQIHQSWDYLASELNQHMNTKKVIDKAEESIRHRVASVIEQTQAEKTKDWAAYAHFLAIIGQMHRKEN